jgi:pyruvate/2-oxoglutarate dehydrogenase complex dihydrolipoamide dehydrogenase (E3) component
MRQVLARKEAMVDGLIAMHLDLYRSSGAELIMGTGRFVAPKTIEVSLNDGGTRMLTATRIALNVGTHATVPDIPGLAPAAPLTNIELLELGRLPTHLVVLGGGYVGLEFAQAYRRFGSRVTILEAGTRLAAREDADIAAALLQMLRDEGIEVHLATKLLGVRGKSGNTVTLHLGTPAGEQTIEVSDILVATGRNPNTHGIGLDIAGVERDERGFIRVNERLETTAPDIWAIGDCAGSPQFTHVSLDDFRVIRDNLGGGQRSTRNRFVPYSSSVVSSNGLGMAMPALFTSTSNRPNVATVVSTAAVTAFASVASARMAIAFPPVPSMSFTSLTAASALFE